MQDRPQFLDGIELASPEVGAVIRKKARRFASWRRPPIVVTPDDFVPLEEANDKVQSRWAPWPTINVLTARGLVQRCYQATDGAEGITKYSLEAEVRWRQNASTKDHLRRLLRAVNKGL